MSSSRAEQHLGRGNLPPAAPVLAGLAVERMCWHLPLLHGYLQGAQDMELCLACAQHLELDFPRAGSLTWLSLLQKDTSGDYRKALLALCGGED